VARVWTLFAWLGSDTAITATTGRPKWSARTADRARGESVTERVQAMAIGAHELRRLEVTARMTGRIPISVHSIAYRPADVSRACARLLKPGGALVFTVVGRVCPWEIAHLRMAVELVTSDNTVCRSVVPVGMNMQHHLGLATTRHASSIGVESDFTLDSTIGDFGVFVPPPYLTWVRIGIHGSMNGYGESIGAWAGGPLLRSVGDPS